MPKEDRERSSEEEKTAQVKKVYSTQCGARTHNPGTKSPMLNRRASQHL